MGRNNHVANYTIHCEGHTVQMINDKWIIDGVQMTMDEMIAKGIATKEGDSRGGKTTNIVVNGNVECIDGNINMLGVKGDVKENLRIMGISLLMVMWMAMWRLIMAISPVAM